MVHCIVVHLHLHVVTLIRTINIIVAHLRIVYIRTASGDIHFAITSSL
jgi:hypothetical protein